MMKRALFVAAAAALIVSSLSGIAAAHPAYKDSDPKSGATVSSPPTELWIEFTEAIERGSIEVYDPCGERADHGEPELNLTSDRLTIGMHGDKAGAYLVKWEVLGSDSHVTRGEFSFTSSGGDACPVADDDDDSEEPPDRDKRDDNDRDDSDRGDVGEDDRTAQTAEANDSRAERRRRDARKPRHEGHRRSAKDRVAGKQLLVQEGSPDVEETSAPGIWDGIPMGDFLVALGVAALIGAAGGRIYAGILGPRR